MTIDWVLLLSGSIRRIRRIRRIHRLN